MEGRKKGIVLGFFWNYPLTSWTFLRRSVPYVGMWKQPDCSCGYHGRVPMDQAGSWHSVMEDRGKKGFLTETKRGVFKMM